MTAFERFRALGCTAVVGADDDDALAGAVDVVRREIADCDAACSRFRDDSELSQLNALAARRPASVAPSAWLADAVATAMDAAVATDGLVDPTIGQCLVDLGYDRDFDAIDLSAPLVVSARHVPAWQQIRLGPTVLRVPAGVRLDLGATAKALCADRAASRAALATGTGVLVSLGGDVAVAVVARLTMPTPGLQRPAPHPRYAKAPQPFAMRSPR